MNTEIHKILVIDDEEDLCEILQFNLEGEGFKIDVAYSAEDALQLDLANYSLILLDVMMGQISGFKFAEKLKKEFNIQTPIIFITAKSTENDLLTGFNLGADDFITKPFSIKEVIARVKAVIKRSKSKTENQQSLIQLDTLVLDVEKRSLRIEDQEINLTRKEFEILQLLLKNIGKPFTREEILDYVWKHESIVTDRTVDVHITRLRKKIGNYGNFIKSKAGYGYTFQYK
jgi:DNA-binding response OmpR family regulator